MLPNQELFTYVLNTSSVITKAETGIHPNASFMPDRPFPNTAYTIRSSYSFQCLLTKVWLIKKSKIQVSWITFLITLRTFFIFCTYNGFSKVKLSWSWGDIKGTMSFCYYVGSKRLNKEKVWMLLNEASDFVSEDRQHWGIHCLLCLSPHWQGLTGLAGQWQGSRRRGATKQKWGLSQGWLARHQPMPGTWWAALKGDEGAGWYLFKVILHQL